MDTFDLKPDAPAEFRGEFNPIKTNVAGRRDLRAPAEAGQVRRQVRPPPRREPHASAPTSSAPKYINTGNRPIPSLEFPGYGAVVTKELGGPQGPAAVRGDPQQHQRCRLPRRAVRPVQHRPARPRPASRSRVRGISLGGGLTVEDVERRREPARRPRHDVSPASRTSSQLLNGLDRFSEQAHAIITLAAGPRGVRHQQGIAGVRQAVRRRALRQSCLLATRLVESGVRFVTIIARRLGHARQQLRRGSRTTLLPTARHRPVGLCSRPAGKGPARDDDRVRHRRVRPHARRSTAAMRRRPRPLSARACSC